MAIRKTKEEFITQLHQTYPNINSDDEYVNGTTKMNFKCDLDGYQWCTTPNVVIGHGCPYCKGTAFEYRENQYLIKAKSNDHVKIVGKFRSKDENVDVQCVYCGEIFSQRPDATTRGAMHKKCYYDIKGGKHFKTQEQYEKEIYKKYGDNITVIGDYIRAKAPIRIRHKCGYEWDVIADSIVGSRTLVGCPKCSGVYKRTSQEYKDEIKNRNIIPLEDYINIHTKILHKCLICDFEWKVSPFTILHNNCGCPMCNGGTNRVVIGINDMWTTNPELASLLADPEDGYRYTQGTMAKVCWKCKECGEVSKPRSIHKVKERGFNCKACSSVRSLPNRIMYNLLVDLNIQFEDEKYFDWCKFTYQGKERSGIYDFVIEHIKIIVEMDGGFHQQDNRLSGQTKEESQFIDDEKDRLAEENGYKIIRIPSEPSTVTYIKNQILQSELNKLFDLSNVNWNKCFYTLSDSLLKPVCEDYNNGTSIQQLHIKYNKDSETIRKFLLCGNEMGLCEYKRIQNIHSVICLEDKNIFKSCAEASRYYTGSNGIAQSISKCCLGTAKTANKKHWMYYEYYLKLYKNIDNEELAV